MVIATADAAYNVPARRMFFFFRAVWIVPNGEAATVLMPVKGEHVSLSVLKRGKYLGAPEKFIFVAIIPGMDAEIQLNIPKTSVWGWNGALKTPKVPVVPQSHIVHNVACSQHTRRAKGRTV